MTEVICLCATKNRHRHVEKLLKCFLLQDYEGKHTLLIYNNSPVKQELDLNSLKDLPENKKVVLLNNDTDLTTKRPYDNLGSIYNDMLVSAEELVTDPGNTLINHTDDDDVFLPNHISAGVAGYKKSGKKAYKPMYSYFRSAHGVVKQNNVFEPSIFVEYNQVKEHGYHPRNVDLHHKWLNSLEREHQILSDPEGLPTFVYDWSGAIRTYKTSGNPNSPSNFRDYAAFSGDVGDQIITPMSKQELLSLVPSLIALEFNKH